MSGAVQVERTLDVPIRPSQAGASTDVAAGDWRQGVQAPTDAELPPIPNHIWGSDHLAVGADIRF